MRRYAMASPTENRCARRAKWNAQHLHCRHESDLPTASPARAIFTMAAGAAVDKSALSLDDLLIFYVELITTCEEIDRPSWQTGSSPRRLTPITLPAAVRLPLVTIGALVMQIPCRHGATMNPQ